MWHRTLLSWSSGKDSAWALHILNQSSEYKVVGLLTTVNEAFDRVAMHAVRRELLEAQARAVNLPLHCVAIPYPCTNDEYESSMEKGLAAAKRDWGVTHIAFGDLYLADVRAYREKQLQGSGLEPVFPIWGQPTDVLARTMVDAGLRAHVTCVDPKRLPTEFAGRTFDATFLDDLPDTVDHCGESGEFHSFAFQGPMFNSPIPIVPGEVIERDGFIFADILSPR